MARGPFDSGPFGLNGMQPCANFRRGRQCRDDDRDCIESQTECVYLCEPPTRRAIRVMVRASNMFSLSHFVCGFVFFGVVGKIGRFSLSLARARACDRVGETPQSLYLCLHPQSRRQESCRALGKAVSVETHITTNGTRDRSAHFRRTRHSRGF